MCYRTFILHPLCPIHPTNKLLTILKNHTLYHSPSRRRPIASRIASAALKLFIKSLCTVAKEVEVDINASSNIALLSGRLNAVTMKASTLVYNGVAISGGAALYTDEIIFTSVDTVTPFAAPPSLAKPFSVSVRATLLEEDLNRRGPLRDALETLLRQIITTGLSGALGRALPQTIGGITCNLDKVSLHETIVETPPLFPFWPFTRRKTPVSDPRGNIMLHGHAILSSGQRLQFAVRAGIATVNDGNIVKLSNPYLLWNNMSIPMLTIEMIGIKLDATTKITGVHIQNGRLSADGITIISPPPVSSRQLKPYQW